MCYLYMNKMSSEVLALAALCLCLVCPLDAEKITITNPSKLSPDGIIREGEPLVLDCNADVLDLSSSLILTTSVMFQRTKGNSPDAIFVFKVEPFSLIDKEPVSTTTRTSLTVSHQFPLPASKEFGEQESRDTLTTRINMAA
ncbi:hypothetical protein ElyMa_004285500 [Elysia marginata]|uniref:Uncharacterized protein n=1 Tax=Elysia marginata TaxID=1093978 RepID=A0AAV4GWY7_9GAST|nr:hypothetical protein ElyMa_004285500 [Elysia marginata]